MCAAQVAAISTVLAATDLDHVVFGTDYPYAALPPRDGDPAPQLDFLGSDRAAVDAGNAAVLVPRLAHALKEVTA